MTPDAATARNRAATRRGGVAAHALRGTRRPLRRHGTRRHGRGGRPHGRRHGGGDGGGGGGGAVSCGGGRRAAALVAPGRGARAPACTRTCCWSAGCADAAHDGRGAVPRPTWAVRGHGCGGPSRLPGASRREPGPLHGPRVWCLLHGAGVAPPSVDARAAAPHRRSSSGQKKRKSAMPAALSND